MTPQALHSRVAHFLETHRLDQWVRTLENTESWAISPPYPPEVLDALSRLTPALEARFPQLGLYDPLRVPEQQRLRGHLLLWLSALPFGECLFWAEHLIRVHPTWGWALLEGSTQSVQKDPLAAPGFLAHRLLCLQHKDTLACLFEAQQMGDVIDALEKLTEKHPPMEDT
jgi:hypothetical protein